MKSERSVRARSCGLESHGQELDFIPIAIGSHWKVLSMKMTGSDL